MGSREERLISGWFKMHINTVISWKIVGFQSYGPMTSLSIISYKTCCMKTLSSPYKSGVVRMKWYSVMMTYTISSTAPCLRKWSNLVALRVSLPSYVGMRCTTRTRLRLWFQKPQECYLVIHHLVQYPMTNITRTHYEDCLHVRVVFAECGIGISWFSCAHEFFNAMMGALVGTYHAMVMKLH